MFRKGLFLSLIAASLEHQKYELLYVCKDSVAGVPLITFLLRLLQAMVTNVVVIVAGHGHQCYVAVENSQVGGG